MEINKQLFEDVLSGKLKGTFVLRSKQKISSNKLIYNNSYYSETHPYRLSNATYTSKGFSSLYDSECSDDIIEFIPETDMKENELKIQVPEGFEIDKENSTFEKIVFKKKDAKPRSWEEYCKQHNTTVTECYFLDNEANVRAFGWYPSVPSDYYRNTLPSKELTEAFRAMMQLMSLRQAWIGDWKPDWRKTISCIVIEDNTLLTATEYTSAQHVLSFPTLEMTKEFMKRFKDLLEIAKPLI